MSPLTRRRTLHGAIGLLAVLAGCSTSETSSSGPDEHFGAARTDPERRTLQRRSPEPILRETDGSTTDDASRLSDRRVLATPEAAADLSIADVDGAAEARTFLDDTDYGSETVYAEQFRTRECFTAKLCEIRWSDTEIETDYARRYRDYDVACEVGAKATFAALIRIPDTLDPESVTSFGSGYGSADCAVRNEPDPDESRAPDAVGGQR